MIDGLPALVDVVIEHPRLAMVKRRSDGRIDFISPLPCPYNYGSIPGFIAGDGDPLDAVVLGPRLPAGTRLRIAVVGVIDFRDDGRADPKVICAERPLSPRQRRGLERFFTVYARFKGLLARLRGSREATRFAGWLTPPAG